MASTRALSEELKKVIVAQWRTGQFTQRDLADSHRVSLGVINKLTKGVDKDTQEIVNKLVEAKQGLSKLDEQNVHAVHDAVHEKTRLLEYLDKAALKNVQESMKAPCKDQLDYKHRASTIATAKEVLVGKKPDVAVQVNNTTQGAPSVSEYLAAREKILTEY